ncbi:NAD-dependent epimerase/dehydratase family protein [Hamadaea tsunoensis]|uniref:NAD-dependent epimerase/dehydratase family protein n=1 Tax=Hamadaea tsunoensis TaxID=53368 RepID=UPI0004003458|nr:NAD(P)-dependent oxidoreductase [Hamadaea tsunoensis]
MKVLYIGGAGYVGRFLVPLLARKHEIRVFDRTDPDLAEAEFLRGDATDYEALLAAMDGIDVVLHGAMGDIDWSTPAAVAQAYDVNVKSVHLTLLAAHAAGVPHAVHFSSLSVFDDLMHRPCAEDDVPDATDLYGLTKRLGEQVCRAAYAEWGVTVTILRLVWPTSDEDWPEWTRHGEPEALVSPAGEVIEATAASDLARAVLAALDHRDGCDVFTLSGDRKARLWSVEKAARLLGWTPLGPVPSP